jgi:tetratricopeptide (TPR) repeat protein
MPGRIEKTVFISYRRTNSFMARAVYQSLNAKGFDIFFDYEGINSGDFEQIILGNLRARAHFLIILTPSALEQCSEPEDWLRKEIEAAIEEKRNIVPLFFEGFNFTTPSIARHLTGRIAMLKNYNGLNVPSDYFNEAMDKLINRFLNISLNAVLHPLSSNAKKSADSQKAAIEKTSRVTERDLSAEEWFERGYKSSDLIEKINCYTESIRLKPDFAAAYNNRATAHYENGDLAAAIKDYDEAIRLKLDYAQAYNNRGSVHAQTNNFDDAIKDFSEAIHLKADYSLAYNNRSIMRKYKGDLEGAVADCHRAIIFDMHLSSAYYNLACYEAILGNKKLSLLFLGKALKLENRFFDMAQAEPDFENLRNDLEFQELIDEKKDS